MLLTTTFYIIEKIVVVSHRTYNYLLLSTTFYATIRMSTGEILL